MSFGSHEMVVRIALEGTFSRPGVNAWMLGKAELLGVHGWSRERQADGTLEALFAGNVTAVLDMVRLFSEDGLPDGIEAVREREVTGSEPVWLGFHNLPGV